MAPQRALGADTAARRRPSTLRQPRSDGIATTGSLLYALLDAAVDSYFPELDGISDRIDAIEDRVLEGEADRESLAEILHLKRRLLELRRVLAPMRDVANALLRRDLEIVDAASAPYYQDLYDHLVRVLDQLDVCATSSPPCSTPASPWPATPSTPS